LLITKENNQKMCEVLNPKESHQNEMCPRISIYIHTSLPSQLAKKHNISQYEMRQLNFSDSMAQACMHAHAHTFPYTYIFWHMLTPTHTLQVSFKVQCSKESSKAAVAKFLSLILIGLWREGRLIQAARSSWKVSPKT
jgi:hypothetical protein